jgi:hypothetical protein
VQWKPGAAPRPARAGWYDIGFAKASSKTGAAVEVKVAGYAVGVLVMHGEYGMGKVTDVGGHGALRKVNVRFSTGERTFIAEKAKLSIVEGVAFDHAWQASCTGMGSITRVAAAPRVSCIISCQGH